MTQDELKALLDYDPVTGIFRWKVKISKRHNIGDVAGTKNKQYVGIQIKGLYYLAHRLAWLYVYGRWPDGLLDHRDGPLNNIDNLREASHTQNNGNMRVKRNGLKGVHKRKRKSPWRASIKFEGKYYSLGSFATEVEAHQAYMDGAQKFFGSFARAA